MKRILRAAATALLLAAAPAAAGEAEDIQAVIGAQLERFQQDDWRGAFAYAAPGLRSLFQTPETFGRMVREGYAMVWRPSRVEAGPLETGPRGPVQIMRFTDRAGVDWVAAYEMVRVDDAWRIAGVRIRRAEDVAA